MHFNRYKYIAINTKGHILPKIS